MSISERRKRMEFFATFAVRFVFGVYADKGRAINEYPQITSCNTYFESWKLINNTFANFDK